MMVNRKKESHNKEVGTILFNHRMKLTDIEKSRKVFIDDRDEYFLIMNIWMKMVMGVG